MSNVDATGLNLISVSRRSVRSGLGKTERMSILESMSSLEEGLEEDSAPRRPSSLMMITSGVDGGVERKEVRAAWNEVRVVG